MATDSTTKTSTNSFIQSLQKGAESTDKKKNKGEIGKNEFLNMKPQYHLSKSFVLILALVYESLPGTPSAPPLGALVNAVIL